jgi:hypothetical protein
MVFDSPSGVVSLGPTLQVPADALRIQFTRFGYTSSVWPQWNIEEDGAYHWRRCPRDYQWKPYVGRCCQVIWVPSVTHVPKFSLVRDSSCMNGKTLHDNSIHGHHRCCLRAIRITSGSCKRLPRRPRTTETRCCAIEIVVRICVYVSY